MNVEDPMDRDQEAIDSIFGSGPEEGRSPSSPGSEDLSELRQLKDLCALALQAEVPREAELQARRVAQRVLARTTREDLGRRGDLGVLLEFFGDRLRDSMLLRFAVAALLVQLTVVPLVAWHLWIEPATGGVRFVLEPEPEPYLYEELPAEEELLAVVGGSDWWDLDGAQSWLQEEADFEGASARLAQLRGRLVGAEEVPTSRTGWALHQWAGPEVAASPLAGEQERSGAEPWIASILRAERLLDEVPRGSWAEVAEALKVVGEVLTLSQAAADSAPPGPLTVLAARTLRRALNLGLAAPIPAVGLSVPGPAVWLGLIGQEAQRAAPEDEFVRRWNRAVREL